MFNGFTPSQTLLFVNAVSLSFSIASLAFEINSRRKISLYNAVSSAEEFRPSWVLTYASIDC